MEAVLSIFLWIITVWLVVGAINGFYCAVTDILLDGETWISRVGVFLLGTAFGPVGAVITIYEELTTRV